MRLFLLPVSRRRTLIYCERVADDPNASRSILDRATNKAADTWASWEKKEKGWQKTVVTYGNKILRRIPFEEWGLKSIPPLTKTREDMWKSGKSKLDVLFPGLYLHQGEVPKILQALATERQDLHRRKMYWSLVGLPITAPFALVPVIPNIPFFYLAFRAYSHWKGPSDHSPLLLVSSRRWTLLGCCSLICTVALSGSKHLEFLIQHNALRSVPSSDLDQGYTAGLMYKTRELSRSSPAPTREQAEKVAELVDRQTGGGTEDVMLLQGWNGKLLAERFHLPEMEVEIERAVEQVENSIKAKERLVEEKKEIEKHAETVVDASKVTK